MQTLTASMVGDVVVDILPASFLDTADRLADFRCTHGRLPVQCDAADPAEEELGDFLRIHRRRAVLHERGRGGAAMEARMAHLERVAPGWRTDNVRPFRRATPTVPFEERVKQVGEYLAAHGAAPSLDDADPTVSAIGRFLVNARQAKKGRGTMVWSDERQALLDAVFPGWEDASSEAKFEQNLTRLRAFVNQHHRAPVRSRRPDAERTDAEREENSLAVFIMNTRTNPDRNATITAIVRAA